MSERCTIDVHSQIADSIRKLSDKVDRHSKRLLRLETAECCPDCGENTARWHPPPAYAWGVTCDNGIDPSTGHKLGCERIQLDARARAAGV